MNETMMTISGIMMSIFGLMLLVMVVKKNNSKK